MPTDQRRAEKAVQDAERIVKDAAMRASGFVVRLMVRAREEVEDVWAEAKSISRSRR